MSAKNNLGHSILPAATGAPPAALPDHNSLKIVFPPDSRVRVTPTTAFPWNTIGQLIMKFPNGKTYGGTGTLIDEWHVLTAAHNLYGNDKGGLAVDVTFIPAFDAGTMPYGSAKAARLFVTDDYTHLSPPDPEETPVLDPNDVTQYTEDYAVIRLKTPFNLPYLTMAAPFDEDIQGTDARITGYPGDKTFGQMWTAHGPLGAPDDEFLFYKIDTFKGESGSAVTVVGEGSPYPVIWGVHVAGSAALGTNWAVRLTEDRIDQINRWRNS